MSTSGDTVSSTSTSSVIGGAHVPRVLRSIGRAVRETLLTIAALGGLACIILVILAFTGGYSLIMFKTGSMGPTIPAGSVALVQETPATELQVGDIVTVDRPGSLPVTHRVTAVEPGTTPAERTITMRGDANEAEDPAPYVIEQGRVVVGSVPRLAHVIVGFGSPWVLGGITLGAATLVTWAFWPREPKHESRNTGERASTGTSTINEDDEAQGSGRGKCSVTLLVGGVLAGSIFGFGVPTQAAATDPLVLRSDLASDVTHMVSVDYPLFWHVGVDASGAPSDGDLQIAMASTGDSALGLQMQILLCDSAWIEGDCDSGARVLLAQEHPVLDGSWRELLRVDTPAEAYLRVALTAQPDSSATGDETTQITVRASAGEWSQDITLDGEGDLAHTGSAAFGLLLAPAAVVVGLIAAWLGRRGARIRREDVSR